MNSGPDMTTGGHGGEFPVTRHSAIFALRSADSAERRRAMDSIAEVYWRPVYTHIRLRWRRESEEARDLTQGFFLLAIEKEYFASFDPTRARFRTFLRVCLDRYIQHEDASEGRQKRGGQIEFIPLDLEGLENSISSPATNSPDKNFEVEWARSLLSVSIQRLREHCAAHGRQQALQAFETYDLFDNAGATRPTYAELATQLGTATDDITNQLAYARREFRRIVLELLRELTASDEEFREEARTLLGLELK